MVFFSMVISVRDILTWIQFINITYSSLSLFQSFCHGAHLVFLDALGCGSSSFRGSEGKVLASNHMRALLKSHGIDYNEDIGPIGEFLCDDEKCGIMPFMISKGSNLQCVFRPNTWSSYDYSILRS